MKSRVVTHIEVDDPTHGEIEVECHVAISHDPGNLGGPPDGWVEPFTDAELIEAFYDGSNSGTVSKAMARIPIELSDADAERACDKAVEEYDGE